MLSPSRNSYPANKNRLRTLLRNFHKQTIFNIESWIVSIAVHVAIICVLAFWSLPVLNRHLDTLLDLNPEFSEIVDLDEVHLEPFKLDLEMENMDAQELPEAVPMDLSMMEELASLPLEDDLELAIGALEQIDLSKESALLSDFINVPDSSDQGFAGRGPLAKARILHRNGGSMASEKAVKDSLDWLARHQNPDGTWSFDHRYGPCQGRCSGAGELRTAVRAATGLALLPFLGAGQTHVLDGPYKYVVEQGIRALVNRMEVNEHGGSLHEIGGNMYSHGIASMALCEAYAMTGDSALRQPAQLAINFICYAQDPVGGGWRYAPQQPGDTSVMGWQVMALKSGYMAALSVPPSVVLRAGLFLDSTQVDRGEGYCYGRHDECRYEPTTSAIGLLCRMYLGSKQDDEFLNQGIERLAKHPPSEKNAYYNYYAAQALFQHSSAKGQLWREWNEQMRSMLIQSQAQEGHEKGSWAFDLTAPHNTQGGRLYCTALSAMTLEVYYRYLPIYKSKSVQSDFEE